MARGSGERARGPRLSEACSPRRRDLEIKIEDKINDEAAPLVDVGPRIKDWESGKGLRVYLLCEGAREATEPCE